MKRYFFNKRIRIQFYDNESTWESFAFTIIPSISVQRYPGSVYINIFWGIWVFELSWG